MIKQILILDDSPAARFDLKTKVNKIMSPENIHEAPNYEKAVEIMRYHPIDVALVDLSMPKKNGMDFIVDFIRTDHNLRNTPVIVTTSVDENSVLRKALMGRVQGYLTKPIQIDLLETTLNNIYLTNDHFESNQNSCYTGSI